MKKILAYAFSALCAVLMSICFTSCHDNYDDYNVSDDFTRQDSIAIQEIAVQALSNPLFYDVNEFMDYANRARQRYDDETVVVELSRPVLATIADVILKRNEVITVHEVAAEYYRNENIYSAMNERVNMQQSPTYSPDQMTNTAPPDSGGSEVPIVEYEHLKKKGGNHE